MWGCNDPAHAQRLADQGLTFGPPPDWLVDRPIPRPADAPDGAVRLLLSDTQIDLAGARSWSNRLVQHALNADGVARVASFNFAYEPRFERAVVHRVRLYRNGQVIDLAEPDAFQLLRRESNLERRMYDGALTADMQLPDIRPGDHVQTWFTIFGANPVAGHVFDAHFNFGWAEPVEETWVRLRASASRRFVIRPEPVAWAGPACTELAVAEGVIEREWVTRRLPVFHYDEATPPSWIGHARLRVADDLEWSAIADLYRPGYAATAELPPSLAEEIQRIAATWADPAARTVEALRFVQREVRYLAVSMGVGGLVPRQIGEIWARRFGDCKDVSRLLCAMLQRLGIDAVPALVNSVTGQRLDEATPGAYAFNHCIVRVRLAGKTWWLDAAGGEQGGDLDHVLQPAFGWALALEPHARLEPVATQDEPVLIQSSEDCFTFGPRPDSPAELEIRTVYRGWKADEIRANIRRDGLARVQQHWESWFNRNYGGATMLRPTEVADDCVANALTVSEAYRLSRPWERMGGVARFSSVDDVFRGDLSVLPHSGRQQPLGLGRPRRMQRTSVFRMPRVWNVQPWLDEVDAPGIRGRSSLSASQGGAVVTLAMDYAITAPEVAPVDLESFGQGVDKLRSGASVTLTSTIDESGDFTKASPVGGHTWASSPLRWVVYFVITLVLMRAVAHLVN